MSIVLRLYLLFFEFFDLFFIFNFFNLTLHNIYFYIDNHCYNYYVITIF